VARRIVAVIGAGDADPAVLDDAREVGRLLAAAGFVVVTGGLGGVMEAASEGARSAGGLVVGLVPGADPAQANPHVDVVVATGLGDARNALIANTAEGFVAVSGSYGTLSEIAFALKRGKPVVSLGSFEQGLPVHPAADPAEAVATLLGLLES
jgi:uncharacterized protein (TIGR00725 family)